MKIMAMVSLRRCGTRRCCSGRFVSHTRNMQCDVRLNEIPSHVGIIVGCALCIVCFKNVLQHRGRGEGTV